MAKDLTWGGTGADSRIEIGGLTNMVQLIVEAAIGGTIAIVGTRSGRGQRRGKRICTYRLGYILDVSWIDIGYNEKERLRRF